MSIICKERPILFTGEMVKARDAGIKTMTRRIIKPQPKVIVGDKNILSDVCRAKLKINCPYGTVRDRLYIKEDYKYSIQNGDILVDYRDKYNESGIRLFHISNLDQKTRDRLWAGKQNVWKSKLLMFKFMARRFDEITNIRVERVQDISEADAKAEGVYKYRDENCYKIYTTTTSFGASSPVFSFQSLWDSINKDRGYSWESNPWVWIIEFKAI